MVNKKKAEFAIDHITKVYNDDVDKVDIYKRAYLRGTNEERYLMMFRFFKNDKTLDIDEATCACDLVVQLEPTQEPCHLFSKEMNDFRKNCFIYKGVEENEEKSLTAFLLWSNQKRYLFFRHHHPFIYFSFICYSFYRNYKIVIDRLLQLMIQERSAIHKKAEFEVHKSIKSYLHVKF